MTATAHSAVEWTTVYFIRQGSDGPIKIGRSESVERRLAALQTAHAEKLELLSAARVPVQVEGLLHDMLSDERLRGEWFAPTELVLAAASAFANPEIEQSFIDAIEYHALLDSFPRKLRLDDETTCPIGQARASDWLAFDALCERELQEHAAKRERERAAIEEIVARLEAAGPDATTLDGGLVPWARSAAA